MQYNTDQLVEAALQFHIQLTDLQVEQFIKYYELLIEWNEKINLTAITDYNEVIIKHFVDSISIAPYLTDVNNKKMIDIGTGAGFPGIPLKIIFPELDITLLDSLDKRIKFLDCVIQTLELNQISTIHGRAEDFAKPQQLRETFDYVVSRAVANLSTLSEYCLPYIKIGGTFYSYKAETAEEEMINAKKAVFLLGGEMKDPIKFNLPFSDISRSICIIQKKTKTSNQYPRKAGLPSKKPL